MADKSNIALFVERFVEFNQTRYADDDQMLPLFTGLTEDMLTVTEITEIEGGAKRSATVKSAVRNFIGENQTWTPGLAATDLNLYNLTSEEIVASKEALSEITIPGLYAYQVGEDEIRVGLVVNFDIEEDGEAEAVEQVLRAGLVYEPGTIQVDNTANTVTVGGNTYVGQLEYVIGTEPARIIPATDYGTLVGAAKA